MLGQEGYVEIQVMYRQGVSIKAISRELGLSRNTVRKYLRATEVPGYAQRVRRPSKLDAYKDYLHERIEAAHPDWIPASVLFDEITALGYDGCSSSVRSYVQTLKPQARPDPVVRFETDPGQQAQVDWGSFKLGDQLAVMPLIGHLMRHDQMMFGIHSRLDVIAHHAGTTATGGHRACIRICQ